MILNVSGHRLPLSTNQGNIVSLLVRERRKLTGNELQVVGGQDWRKRISEVRKLLGCECHKALCQAMLHIKNETVPGETYDRYWIAKQKTQDEVETLAREVFTPVDTIVKQVQPVDAIAAKPSGPVDSIQLKMWGEKIRGILKEKQGQPWRVHERTG